MWNISIICHIQLEELKQIIEAREQGEKGEEKEEEDEGDPKKGHGIASLLSVVQNSCSRVD